MIDLNTYKREYRLRDGTKVLLRPMVKEDEEALFEFFKGVPDEEARYLRDDVRNRSVIKKWAEELDYSRTLPLLAFKNSDIIADATLFRRRFGWKWHLGNVRIFVHKDYRKVGLGSLMIRETVDIAMKLKLEKLLAEIPANNIPAINAFRSCGFGRVAVIPGLARDRENHPIDIAIMTRDIEPLHEDEYYHL